MAHESRPRTLDPENLGPLETWLADRIGADSLKIEKAELLSGGAIGENWRLDAWVEGGGHHGKQNWVLRTDAATRMAMSHDRANEFACLNAGHDAGVLVPEPIAECANAGLIGAPFMVVGYVVGYAQGHKMVRDPAIEKAGSALAEALGSQLAKIHSVRPPGNGLGFLALPEKSPA